MLRHGIWSKHLARYTDKKCKKQSTFLIPLSKLIIVMEIECEGHAGSPILYATLLPAAAIAVYSLLVAWHLHVKSCAKFQK